MEVTRGFIAQEAELSFYNAKALINVVFSFYYVDVDSTGEATETAYTFPGFVSAYFRVYNDEKREELIKSFPTQLTRNSNTLIMNCSVLDMTFDEIGQHYYFEMGFNSSGYEIPLRYGRLPIV